MLTLNTPDIRNHLKANMLLVSLPLLVLLYLWAGIGWMEFCVMVELGTCLAGETLTFESRQ